MLLICIDELFLFSIYVTGVFSDLCQLELETVETMETNPTATLECETWSNWNFPNKTIASIHLDQRGSGERLMRDSGMVRSGSYLKLSMSNRTHSLAVSPYRTPLLAHQMALMPQRHCRSWCLCGHPAAQECQAMEANHGRRHRQERRSASVKISGSRARAKLERLPPPEPRRNETSRDISFGNTLLVSGCIA